MKKKYFSEKESRNRTLFELIRKIIIILKIMSLKSSSSSCSDISIDEIQSREETGMLMTRKEIL